MYSRYSDIPPPQIVQPWQGYFWLFLTLIMFLAWSAFLARRLSRDFTLSERLLGAFLATVTQILASSLLLGTLGVLFWWPLGVLNATVSAMVIFRTSKIKEGRSILQEFSLLCGTICRLARSSTALLFMGSLSLILGAWMIYIGLLLPTWCYDSWHVSLPWAAYAHQEGHLGPFNQPVSFINAYPMNAEVMFLWWIIGQGSDRVSNICQAPFMYAAALATYIIARNVGVRRVDSAIAALTVFSVPTAFQAMWIAKNDVVVMGVVLAAMALLSRRHLNNWALALAACACGFSIGSKGPFFFPGLLLFLAIRLFPTRLDGLRVAPPRRLGSATGALILFAGLSLILGSVFYLKNWLFLGNPMGIFKVQIGPWILFNGVDPLHELFKVGAWGERLHEELSAGPVGPIVVDGLFDPAMHQFALTRIGGWGPVFTTLLLPAIPVAFIWAMIRRSWIAPAVMVGLIIPLFIFAPIQLVMTRYHLQMVGVGALAFAFIISTLRKTRYRRLFVAVACASMLMSVFLYGPPTYETMIRPELIASMRQQPYSERERFTYFIDDWGDHLFVDALKQSTLPGTTIAYTLVPGTGQFLALWNPGFSNRVVFVPWEQSGFVWTRDLLDSGADSVFVGNNSPHQAWAIAHPEAFVPLYSGSLGSIFTVRR